jgi:hypothetical protein
MDDISKENIELINKVYKRDFEEFEYTIVNPEDYTSISLINQESDNKVSLTVTKSIPPTIQPSIVKKQLRFIHITRTGGTSIEQEGLEKSKFWGRYHRGYGQFDEIFRKKPEPLRKSVDWFMVVRNPYNRVISEYQFLLTILKIPNPLTKEAFNTFIDTWLMNILHNKENHPIHGKLNGGHFTPQFKYIDPIIKIHILKFENLENEFNDLMKKYEYDIVLHRKANISKKIFTVHDISEQNLKLIQNVYKRDFEQFNYSIEPPI